MNEKQNNPSESALDAHSQQIQILTESGLSQVLGAWNVETADISDRISSEIVATTDPVADLVVELRALREEIRDLRRATAELQDEIARMRQDPLRRTLTRIAPFTASEQLIRLS